MEINEENCKPFENGRKAIQLWILPYSFSSRNKKQTKNNLLTLTIPSEKRSGLTWYSESGQVSQAGGFCERS